VLPTELGVASDVFALGLIYSEFLTGATPPFDVARYHEPAVAVRSGETLRIPRDGVVPTVADLVDAMLLADSTRRPSIGQVHAALMAVRLPSETAAAPAASRTLRPPASAATTAPAPSGGLRGKGLRITSPAGSEAPATPATPATPTATTPAVPTTPAGRLVGKLVGKLTGRSHR